MLKTIIPQGGKRKLSNLEDKSKSILEFDLLEDNYKMLNFGTLLG